MNIKQLLVIGASVLTSFLCGRALTAETHDPYVRIAELEVDPAQLESFKAATREVGQTSVRVEPGCLVLYAVSEKEKPGRVRVFEIYRDEDAYKVHLQTPHFKKFRATTDNMVKSRKLIDTVPISLAAKAKRGRGARLLTTQSKQDGSKGTQMQRLTALCQRAGRISCLTEKHSLKEKRVCQGTEQQNQKPSVQA